MAHFAQLDENNVVTQVIVIANEELIDPATGKESEQKGIEFCKSLFKNRNANWVQTSYNHNFRKRYAGVGYTYDSTLDAFIRPKPYPSWTLDTQKADWVPPVLPPRDGKNYYWSEEKQQWIEWDIKKTLSGG
jgi:hypothetical protein